LNLHGGFEDEAALIVRLEIRSNQRSIGCEIIAPPRREKIESPLFPRTQLSKTEKEKL
jgi:hypothetical protein